MSDLTNKAPVVFVLGIAFITALIGVVSSVKLQSLINDCKFEKIDAIAKERGADKVPYGALEESESMAGINLEEGTFQFFGSSAAIWGYSGIALFCLLMLSYTLKDADNKINRTFAGMCACFMGTWTLVNSGVTISKWYSDSNYGTYFDKIQMCKKEACGIIKEDVSGSCQSKGDHKCSDLRSGQIDYDFHSTKVSYIFAMIMGVLILVCSFVLFVWKTKKAQLNAAMKKFKQQKPT